MDYSKKYTQRLSLLVVALIISSVLLSLGAWLFLESLFDDLLLQAAVWTIIASTIVVIVTTLIVKSSFKPLSKLSDAILFAGHSARGGTPPDTEHLRVGREMITALALQVYDLASMSTQGTKIGVSAGNPELSSDQLLDRIGLPIIGIDQQQLITTINKPACDFLAVRANATIGKPVFDLLKMSFESDETFEIWLKDKQSNAVNGIRQWERVRTTDAENQPVKQFDMVASYIKSSSGTETFLALFDKTEEYARDDSEVSFVSLAVHELRTPLTVMKGYIEVFEDEVGPELNEELKGFMHKMRASAEQLTAFVGNILNVARVEENQLVLKLQSYDWVEVLKRAVEDLSLRAAVHGKQIELHAAPDLPPVAVDRISIHEVINNLVDNAIKYSEKADRIVITTQLNNDGEVETSVQDFGIGIPSAVMPDLFQKFYRSHKSRIQIGGTGLGLYLCKAIVSAHGGNIWVRSKEGEGSIFSFTVKPFDQIRHEQEDGQDGIMRGAHGWIKNHSLNRQ